jgi:alkaline phosphatase
MIIVSLVLLLLLCVFTAQALAKPTTNPEKPLAKNIIIMVADGMGFNQFLAGDYYLSGKAGTQPYEQFPFQFAVSTYPYVAAGVTGYDPLNAWTDFNYVRYPESMPPVTESDAAATAMATGVKNDGGLGYDVLGNSVANILDYAEAAGKSTGVISTVPFDHATPAAFAVHNKTRSPYPPIASKMIASGLEVIMGGGNPYYNVDAQEIAPVWTYISPADYAGLQTYTGPGDWKLVESETAFEALMSGPTPDRVFGIARVAETLQQQRSGGINSILPPKPWTVPPAFYTSNLPGTPSPDLPFEAGAPLNTGVPTLVEMTKGALNVLDNNPDGFVVMIEGGATDNSAHEMKPGRMIEDLADFNASVQAVMDWVQKNSNWGETLLIVTADHETGGIWGPDSDLSTNTSVANPSTWPAVINNGAGQLPGLQWYGDLSPRNNRWHTNSLTPLWAKGDAARVFKTYATNSDPVRGAYVDNTDIFKVMYRALGWPTLP